MDHHRMFIGGRWCEAGSGGRREAVNPATGEAFATVAWGDRGDARRGIEAAERARKDWARTPLWERADLCIRMAELLEARWTEIADVLTTECGKPRHTEAAIEAESFVPIMYRQAAELARYQEGSTFMGRDARKRMTTFRRPRGTVAVITPWNFPAMIPSEYVPYALVQGNAVVWTPAPTAAVTAATLMGILEEAGLPDGILNLVIGPGQEVGDELVTSSGTHAVAMTGSTATGRAISARCGLKPRLLELGGNGPTIVLPDADPVRAARAVAPACFFGAGQVCSAAERILVARELEDPFVEAMVAESAKWNVGDPWDESTTMGPQNNPGVLETMARHLDDARQRGATIVAGGGRPHGPGYFHEPTVLRGFDDECLLNREETFGPIAPIRSFASDEEAVRQVESCDLGLVAAVFTRDVDAAWRWAERLRTGVVVVNDNSNYWEPHVPFGGMAGGASGVGRLGGRQVLEFMGDLQTVAFHVG